MTIEAHGYAVVENGEINVRSVSPTRRAAMVNFLLTDRATMILNSMADPEIETIWDAKHRGAVIVPVKITRVE